MNLLKSVKKSLAFFMAVLMLVPGNLSAEVMASEVLSDKGDGVFLDIEWEDSEFKSGSTFHIVEDSDTTNAVKIRVSYSSEKTDERGYEPGEMVITIKGIGAVGRNGTIEAQVGADKVSEGTKNRDWSYTWSKAKDTYTFTNNHTIEPNTVMSGYFDMVWLVKARDSIHGYEQTDIQAELLTSDGQRISSPILKFKNETMCDGYKIDIERSSLYSYRGVSGNLSNPNDYMFIKYPLTSFVHRKSRGIRNKEIFLFNPDVTKIGSGATSTYSTNQFRAKGDGTYEIDLENNTVDEQYIVVAYPREKYVNKQIKAAIASYGAFLEGNDEGVMEQVNLASDEIEFVVPADFDFKETGGPGDGLLIQAKESEFEHQERTNASYADKVLGRGGQVLGSTLYYGSIYNFYLGFDFFAPNDNSLGYTVELTDDFLYITQNNGKYRQLVTSDYEFSNILLHSTLNFKNENGVGVTPGKYAVKVYAVQNDKVLKTQELTPVWEGLWMNYDQSVNLPEGTTAFAVRFENLEEDITGSVLADQEGSYQIKKPIVEASVKFHLSEEGWEKAEQSNVMDGQAVNTSFVNIYNGEGRLVNHDATEENYHDGEINLDLAKKDLDLYGRYLFRRRGAVSFYGAEKSDYKAYTDLGSITEGSEVFTARMTMGADFNFKENEIPDNFSLYTLLPEKSDLKDYEIEEDIWDIVTFSGLGLSQEQLLGHCSCEVIKNYKDSGRTYVAFHFNFEGMSILRESSIRAAFDLNIERDFFKKDVKSTVNVRSTVMINRNVNANLTGKVLDNGNWDKTSGVLADIDRDSNTSEVLSYNYDYASYTYVDSSELQMTKAVKTSSARQYQQLPSVPLEEQGGSYTYRLTIKNGNNRSKNIVVTDILENGEHSMWKGNLKEIDLSDADKKGFSYKVWYSSSIEPGMLGSKEWSTIPPKKVRALAIDLGESELKEGESLNIYVHMEAPREDSLKGKITENNFSAAFDLIDAKSGEVTKSDILKSNFVRVQLSAELKTLIVIKEDAVDRSRLSGAIFRLIDKKTGEMISEGTTNAKGLLVFKNIPLDITYVLREISAPPGYEKAEDTEIVFSNAKVTYVTINDKRKTGTVEILKRNSLDNNMKVAGAEYTLYRASDGEIIAKGVTDAIGRLVFKDIEWGAYYFKETKAPEGYTLNAREYKFSFNKDNVEEKREYTIRNDQEGNSGVRLVKYAMTTAGVQTQEPVSGAVFELLRTTNGQEKSMGIYVTDKDGEIIVDDLAYGDYLFREITAPVGYEIVDSQTFALTPEKKECELVVYNKRKSGSIHLYKKDELGNIVTGAVFELFDETKENVLGTYTTDAMGSIDIRNLEWGTYYLKEKSAPDCYLLNEEFVEVKINGRNLSSEVTCTNLCKKGSIILTKTDEIGKNKLQGAVFHLYKSDGSLLMENLVTNENGEVRVDDLEWGNYYFKETKAPQGYGISDEVIRFSVNRVNAGIVQKVQVTDPLDAKTIRLTKKINVSDINFANGDPTFLFKVEGTDIHGHSHTYYRIVKFNKDYVTGVNTDEEGYVSQSVTVSGLVEGIYTAMEEESSRYVLSGIESLTANAVVTGSKVSFDLRLENEGRAVFKNEKYEHQDYSDNQSAANVLKKEAKLTAIKVNWLGSKNVEARTEIQKSLMEVIAIYDDGSARVLENDEFNFGEHTEGVKFPNVNGDYAIEVEYTEGGVTVKNIDYVTIYGAVKEIVRLEASVKAEYQELPPSTKLTPDMFHVTAVFSDNSREVLNPEKDVMLGTTISPEESGIFEVLILLNSSKYEENISTTVTMLSRFPEALLVSGEEFCSKIPNTATSVVFTNENPEVIVQFTDLSVAKDFSIVGWLDGTVWKVSARQKAQIMANPDCYRMFYQKTKLVSIDLEYLDTKYTNSMRQMFKECSVLKKIKFGNDFTTASVTNMNAMFDRCFVLEELDLSGFDTSNVATIRTMFQGCYALETLDVSGFDTSNVTDMAYTFNKCEGLRELDLSGFDTSNVTNMRSMLQECYVLEELDVSNFDTQNVTDMAYMFNQCKYLTELDVSRFRTNNVTTMRSMFQCCENIAELDVSNFDTGNVIDMAYMFSKCVSLSSLDIADWNVSKVTDLENFLGQYNAGNPSCSIKELDLSKWDVSNVTNLRWIFYGMAKLERINVSTWNTSNVENFRHVFTHCRSLKYFDCSNWDVSNAKSLDGMFHSTKKQIYDVSKWKTSKCLTFSQLFEGCSNATEIIGLENMDTSSGKTFVEMFNGCSNLRKLDLSNFDMSAIDENWVDPDVGYAEGTTSYMLAGVTRLQELKLGEKFVFKANMKLPAPSDKYISGADGYWYSENTGIQYAADALPANVADIYRPIRTTYMRKED